MKVEVKNFQAISHTSFDISGFTAVVGRSNIGKSAVVRALKCALTGAGGTDFVRHDPKTCDRVVKGNKKCKCFSSVKLSFDNGNILLWEKGDTKNQYTTWVEGVKQEYTRVGKNPEMPPMLQGFDPIKLGERNRELVQVADQFEGPLFLLNVAGPTVADLLSDVAKLDDINQAMRLVTKDRKEANSTRKVREEDAKAIEIELQKYRGLDNTAVKVAKVQESQSKLQTLANSVQEAIRYLKAFSSLATSIKGLRASLEPDLPEDTLSGKVEGLKTLAKYLRSYNLQVSEVDALDGVDKVDVPDVPDIQGKLATLGRIDGWTAHLKEIKAVVKGFSALQDLPFPEDLPQGFKLDQLQKLDQYHEELTELEESIEGLEGELSKLDQELEDLHEQYSEIDFCPVCAQSMPEDLLREAT